MPIIASLIKIAVLSLALLCVDIKPMRVPAETADNSPSWKSHCRIYFGCVPSARTSLESEWTR